MIACYECDRVPEKRECGRCRLVLKHELAEAALGTARVYLDETNRNKNGRPSKTKDDKVCYRVAKRYKEVRSYRKVAEEFGMGKDSVMKIIKSYGSNLEYLK